VKIPPKDFFEMLESGAITGDLRVVVNGQWCSFVISEVAYNTNPRNGDMSAMLTGELLPDKPFEGFVNRSTVARLGQHNIPCEVFCISIDHENINFQTRGSLPVRKRIKVGIIVSYSAYNANFGDFTDAEGEIPVGVKHMIEIEKSPKKKTVFDILDLD